MTEPLIRPLAFHLKPGLSREIHTMPAQEQWTHLFATRFFDGKKGLIYERSLADLLRLAFPDILIVNPLYQKDSAWLTALSEVSKEEIAEVVRSWASAQKFSPKQQSIRADFFRWADGVCADHLPEWQTKTVQLAGSDGAAGDPLMFSLLPRLFAQRIIDQGLAFGRTLLPFMSAGIENNSTRVMSDPFDLFDTGRKRGEPDYYSVALDLSVQTVPHHHFPFVCFAPKIVRFVPARNINHWRLRREQATVYLRIDDRSLFPMKLAAKGKEAGWEKVREAVFRSHFVGVPFPGAAAYLADPAAFTTRERGGMYLTYSQRMKADVTRVGSGMTMRDKDDLYQQIYELTKDLAVETGTFERRQAGPYKYQTQKMALGKDRCRFRRQLAQAIGADQLTIEVCYPDASNPLIARIDGKLDEFFGLNDPDSQTEELNVAVTHHELPELKDNLVGETAVAKYEARAAQIRTHLGRTDGVTCALVLIPYKDEDGKLYFQPDADPKQAIRAGFAQSGRVAQFINALFTRDSALPEDEDNSNDYRIASGIKDLIRQLGYVEPNLKKKKQVAADHHLPFTAIHITKQISTVYGRIPQLFTAVTVDQEQGEVRVTCPALWAGQKLYRDALPALQASVRKLAGRKDKSQLLPVLRDFVTRVYDTQSPHVLLVDARIVKFVWKQIQDQELVRAERTDTYSLKKLWFSRDQKEWDLDLTDPSSALRIIRVRTNEEVPDYVVQKNEEGEYKPHGGLFFYNGVYYGIGSRPFDSSYTSALGTKLKTDQPRKSLKAPDMIEIYPVHLCPGDRADDWAALVNNYRGASYEYTRGNLRHPLPLHMAMQMEEYLS